MKQIAVISGKGGTGKTSLVAAFLSLTGRAVAVDADVDASNLALVLPGEDEPEQPFLAGRRAEIDPMDCALCMECQLACPSSAIQMQEGNAWVDPLICDGCGVCGLVCPMEAISYVEHEAGAWTVRQTENGPLVHARLGIAEDNSGKLVDRLRRESKRLAESESYDLVLIDGPPGVGCPVHATVGGVDHLVAVTEPTVSGAHDLARVLELAEHFSLPASILLNKADIDPEGAARIEEMALEHSTPVVGRIPFDVKVPAALAMGHSILDVDGVGDAVASCWEKLKIFLEPRS